MTTPAPGDIARYAVGGTVRNDPSLGPVVDWVTSSGGSGSTQLAQLPPPTDILPATAQRDAVIVGGQGTEPPIGSVLLRQTPRTIAFRTPAGWIAHTAGGATFGPGAWLDVPAGNWKIIWLGGGT
jgi:hypothetical protein